MSINIQTLAVGSLVLNNGQYYKVIAGNPFKQLQLLTQSELATYFEDNSWTLSYSLDTQSWASYHDYTPYGMVNTRNLLYSFNYDEVYKHNIPNKYARYYYDGGSQPTYASYVDAVFNAEGSTTKLFSTVNWISKIKNSSGANIHQKTITDLMIYNSYQCSGNIDLVLKTSSNEANISNYNMYNKEGTWSVNKFRDVVINPDNSFIDSDLNLVTSNLNSSLPWYNKKRFIDKFIISRFSYSNSEQNSLYLYDVSANMRLSAR